MEDEAERCRHRAQPGGGCRGIKEEWEARCQAERWAPLCSGWTVPAQPVLLRPPVSTLTSSPPSLSFICLQEPAAQVPGPCFPSAAIHSPAGAVYPSKVNSTEAPAATLLVPAAPRPVLHCFLPVATLLLLQVVLPAPAAPRPGGCARAPAGCLPAPGGTGSRMPHPGAGRGGCGARGQGETIEAVCGGIPHTFRGDVSVVRG